MAILVADTGSSSMRTVIFSESGDVLFTAQQAYSMDLGPDGRATMEAAVFEETLCRLCRQAAEFALAQGLTLRGAALTSQRSSVLAVDADGTPLYPILMWYDKRSTADCAQLMAAHGAAIYERCGMRLTPVASAPKMRWLQKNEPAVCAKAYKLMGIHDYLLLQMTGEFVTDASLASRSGLMDIRTFAWSRELCALYGIDPAKLCTLLPPGSIVGPLQKRFAEATGLPCGIPVISAGGDQQCCVLGQGMEGLQAVGINSGSASYMTAVIDRPVADPGMQTSLQAYCVPGRWVCEASNMSSGTAYQWFFQTFYRICGETSLQAMDAEILACTPSANGMICLPDFAGRGCPAADPAARGVFFNIGLDASRGNFARALLEGIACDVAEGVQYMEKLGLSVPQVFSTGGLTKFSAFNQITAALLARPVTVRRQRETTAFGAFVNALTALGDVASPADFFAGYRAPEQIYEPQPADVTLYAELLNKRRYYREKMQS